MDLATFKRELLVALNKPEEWEELGRGEVLGVSGGPKFLQHRQTKFFFDEYDLQKSCGCDLVTAYVDYAGKKVEVCTVPQNIVQRCLGHVRHAATKRHKSVMARKARAFLNNFEGFTRE